MVDAVVLATTAITIKPLYQSTKMMYWGWVNEWASHLCWFIHDIKYGLKCANIWTFVDFDLCNLLFSGERKSTHTHKMRSLYHRHASSFIIKRSAFREWLLMPKMARLWHGSLNVFIFSMTQHYMLRYGIWHQDTKLLAMNWKVESSNSSYSPAPRVCVCVFVSENWRKLYIVNTMAKIFNELLFFGISHVYCFFFRVRKGRNKKECQNHWRKT